MEFWTVTLVSLAAGLVVVIGGALVWYMGSLVKSAYQLKIDIRAEMDNGQRKIEENLDKKVKWIKRDLVEEVDKMKAAVQTDNQRRMTVTADDLTRQVAQAAEEWRNLATDLMKHLESLRHDVMVLDQRTRLLRREQKAAEGAGDDGALLNTLPPAGTPPMPPFTPPPMPNFTVRELPPEPPPAGPEASAAVPAEPPPA